MKEEDSQAHRLLTREPTNPRLGSIEEKPDAAEASDFDWVILSNGARVLVPRLPLQEQEDSGVANPASNGGNSSEKGFHLLEKVRSAWGSTAGAGSDFFHVYRKQRAREMARQEELEKAWIEEEEMRKFQERRLANFKADEERSKKRGEKRKRKKIALACKKEEAKKRRSNASSSTQESGGGALTNSNTDAAKAEDDSEITTDKPRDKTGFETIVIGHESSVDCQEEAKRDMMVGAKPHSEHARPVVKFSVIDDGDTSF